LAFAGCISARRNGCGCANIEFPNCSKIKEQNGSAVSSKRKASQKDKLATHQSAFCEAFYLREDKVKYAAIDSKAYHKRATCIREF
jgi:hypothetical protein